MTTYRTNCYRCHVKQTQSRGLCRGCAIAVGLDQMTPEQFTIARLVAREAQRRNVRKAKPIPPPNRTAVYEGKEFEILFDGRQSLLGEYPA